MIETYTRAQLEKVMQPEEVIKAVEEGFIAYSQGKTVIPPVGELIFDDPRGDCHIKYGFRKGEPTFTIKIATGFSANAELGISTSNGVILVFSSKTGQLTNILQDEGFLTNIRTSAAGAVVAKLLAPKKVSCIGIIGAGIQGKLQLDYLRYVQPTRRAMIFDQIRERAQTYAVDGFEIQVATSVAEVAANCNLIVTTTPSRKWYLGASDVRPGTHITAIGADGEGKQELDPQLFTKAAVRVVDSRKQCVRAGDSSYALKQGLIQLEDLIELGELAQDPSLGRRNDTDITIADLQGVAIQDIQVAQLAVNAMAGRDAVTANC
ncbi:MAG: hypothetical protein ABSG52_11725 [Terriglobales bacterium]|jgi:ornithine cyclodeaminase